MVCDANRRQLCLPAGDRERHNVITQNSSSGKMMRSQEEFVRSLSSQSVLFSSPGITNDRTTRAKPRFVLT